MSLSSIQKKQKIKIKCLVFLRFLPNLSSSGVTHFLEKLSQMLPSASPLVTAPLKLSLG